MYLYIHLQLYSENGLIVSSCPELRTHTRFSIVPSSQRFIFIPFQIGDVIDLPYVSSEGPSVSLKTISQEPKVFEVFNFFTETDADFLISNALSLTDQTMKLKRSTTGSENIQIDRKRTSDSAFDISSTVAMKLKRKSQELLRFGPYDETLMDGLQILRYNISGAYNNHYDYIESSADIKYDSAHGGTNRFATLLFYLNTVEEGGETVFPNSPTEPDIVHRIGNSAQTEQQVLPSVSGDISVQDMKDNGGDLHTQHSAIM